MNLPNDPADPITNEPPAPRGDSALRLLRITWPFLATVPLLLLIAAASFYLLAAGRAYVEGESLWSKGQKNAIQFLARFSESCDPALFAQYRTALAVPLGDGIARRELLKPDPDLARATAGFLAGGNHPAEVPGMIVLFRYFRSVPLLQEALVAEPARRKAALSTLRGMLTAELREGDPNAAVRSVLCLRDVSREHEIERLKSEFMSIAAHELRTPMASIYGFVELMLHRPMTPERRSEVVQILHRQSRLMIGIIDDVLDLSRLEARRGEGLKMEPLDLSALVRAAAEGFTLLPGRPAPLLPALPEGLTVHGDRDKLARVLGNVLSNAYKYSPRGGDVRISVLPAADDGSAGDAAGPGRRVGVRIEDQGIGMTAAQLQRVGERFFRADTSGNIPGTGLGMSIVREILQLHGGQLTVDSEPGHGTCVTIWLPLHATADQAGSLPAPQAQPDAIAS